jgi:ubiquinol-cytochrome c reductase cytochrome c1 subunit
MLRQRTLTSTLAGSAFRSQTRSFSTGAARKFNPNILGFVIGAGAVGAAAATLIGTARCSEDVVVPPAYPWSFRPEWKSYDVASLRRGHQVYKEVCAACHSLTYIAWRNLVETLYTEEEVIAMAAETEVEDGPNEDGEMFTRPGKPNDYLPRPYPNEEAARAANAGAIPPDLTEMIKAREQGPDYIFALLTGYRPAPAGVNVREGLYYNPYFPGGAIGMPPPLNDGMIEYEDGTEATVSQMAKDVTEFLSWTARPEQDERRVMGIKVLIYLGALFATSWYLKRFKWSVLKNRKVQFPTKNWPTV